MPTSALAASSSSTLATTFHRALLVSALLLTSGLNSVAQIVVSPTTETFAKTVVGVTSASKSVTVTNNGATAQAVNFVMSGDFSETDNCGGSIAGSGGSCVAKISFTPTLVGTITGAASIYDNSKNLLAFVGLSGKSAAPVTTAPASLSFGTVPIGTLSSALSFKITNGTAANINVTAITASSDYVLNTGTCLTTAIAPGKFCTVNVQVQPTSATDNGAVIITDNAPFGTPLAVALTAAGSGGGTDPISLSKTSLTFKSVVAGTSAAQSITVTNTSASAVAMGTITASSDYGIVSNTCPASLAAAGTCTFGIVFAPGFVGKIGGAAAVAYTGNNSPQLVNLSGTALDNLTVAPGKLAFAAQAVGTTSTAKAVKITNNSTSSVTLSSVVPSGDFQIQLSGTTCPLTGGTIGAGKTCTAEIQFAPTISGAIEGSLTVTNSASPNPLLVPLSGSGTNTASATLNPSSAHQGTSETILITGTNTHFGPTTKVNFGADITTGTLTVNGPTSASVPITIDNVAATGARSVTVTTGSEVATASFTVIAGVPQVTLISPNTIQPTQTENVTVTGAFTSWVNGTTKANFGPGIAVGGAPAGTFGPVSVTNGTSLTASLVTSGATTGFRTVQIQTGSQTLTVNNGIDVLTCTASTPTILHLSPVNGATGQPLNAQVQAQFSVPMNRNTFSLGNSGTTTVFFYDGTTGKEIPGAIALDASGTVATITPSVVLPAGRTFYTYWSYANYVQDTCANNLPPQQYSFSTAFNANTTGPTLTGTNPVSGDTNIPLNVPIVLHFDTQIDPVTVLNGVSMVSGSTPVAGNFTFSTDDRTATFTPVNPLAATTSYTVAYSAAITDTAGNPLNNPGSFSFTTGTSSDTTAPTVTGVDPVNGSFGVGLNVMPHLTFSKPVNELTVPPSLTLYYENTSITVPATVTVAANRLSATLTPSAPLLPNTLYIFYLSSYTDIAGNYGSGSYTTFFTGGSSDTNSATVATLSPFNGQTGVPINTQVIAVMSDDIDPTSVNSTSITVTKQGGGAVSGTVTLANDGVTLTFVPGAPLAVSTVYNVSVGGFKDTEGTLVTTSNTSFTTGTTGYGSGSFTVVSTSPVTGATGVSVTSPVTLNMSNLINAASVNPNTVFVYVNATNQVVAGNYNVSGASVTFTPLAPYPANTLMSFGAYGLTDEAGNPNYQYGYNFTTANTVDHTAPTVSITPANGTSNVGLNSQVVLTFSKSINPTTLTTNSLALFSGSTAVTPSYTVSRDNRTVVINPGGGTWTPGATITIELTNGIQDLSGNALANTTSQFTLTTELNTNAPSVVVMRPGNGATNVPASTAVTLFTNVAMNPSTIAGALHVTDNGVPVSGALQLFSSGQAIEFTPGNSFTAGDLVQVYLDSSALSASNIPLSNFSAQFTIAGSPANTTAVVQAVNPFVSATNVPLNTNPIQVEYNQALQASTINNTSVTLYQYSTNTYLTPALTLVGNGQVINIAPTSNLVAGSQYQVYVSPNNGVTNTSGVPVQPYAFNFTAGTTTDTVAPTITSQAPTDNATNIGTNSSVAVNFSKAINPVSVTGSTIQLSGGSVTEVPSSISFSPDYTRTSIVPQAPLPPSTQMTFAINGVTGLAGKMVAAKTTHFTTAAQPDFTAPFVTNSSVINGQTNVPVNSAFSLTFSKAMDIGSYAGPTDVGLYDSSTGQYVSSSVSWSSDQTTIFFVPASPLAVGDSYQLFAYYLTDLSGNPQQNFGISFTTSFTSNTNPPTVINTSPENTETAVPVNAPVEILFSEPIQPTSIGQITLTTGGNPVAFTAIFSDANQLLTLTPALLTPSVTYTLTITGVKDTAGNLMAGTVTNTFATGPTFDLIHPSVSIVDPPNATSGVGTNVTPRITFSKRINPLSVVTSSNEAFNRGSVELYNNATGQYVPATVSMSSDRMTAILTPASALSPNTSYAIYVAYGEYYYDVAGNYGGSSYSTFVTGSAADTVHTTVSTIVPANNQTGVPINTQVVAVMSDDIDPTTVSSSSITVKQGTNPVAGTTTLAADGVTLTFVPSAPLAVSTVYSVSVGGFNDAEGNSVTAFTSSFTTGTTGYGSGSFTVVSTSPVTGATGVSVTSPVTLNMSNLINAASVNPNTVFVYVSATNQVVAGNYNVSGASVTFTPLTPYPANTLMAFGAYGLTDEAGNPNYQYGYTFTTANTVDHTAPTVSITPANGASNVGLNSQVVLTFSKSVNPTTVAGSSVNLLNGDTPINPSVSISRDNRTVVLNYNSATLPAGATLTVMASHLITDLSGNALADTTSQFTTTAGTLNSTPYVISMRPGNGATNVPTNTVITLFTSALMNSGSLSGALHVSQGGVLVAGTASVGSNGQSIEFTPNSALSAATPVHVVLDSTAQDIYGNALTYFAGQFTTAGAPANTAAVVQAVNPFVSATNVPLNTNPIQVEYNQALQASTINNSSVTLYQYSTNSYLTPTLSLVGSGHVINIAPTINLISGSQYQVYISPNNAVTNTNGVPVQPYAYNFTAGTTTDTTAPTIQSLAPPDSSANIGTNAGVSVNFNKAINPVSVTGSSIQISGGSVTEVPSSISFTTDFTRTMIIPQAPLPSSTTMAIAISGVTSQAGVAVATQTTHFTTMAGADFSAPSVVHSSPDTDYQQTVGTNAVFAMQFNKPMDPGSVNPGGVTTDVFVYDNNLGTYVATIVSFSSDLTTVFLKPTANLTASHQFQLCSYYMTDLAGNPQQNFCANFFTGSGTDTTGPVVQQVSPPSGFTGIGINAPVQVLFNKPIDGASLAGATLKQGSSVIPTTAILYDGDQGIKLTPLAPTAPNTVYTINVTGVKDITGNTQSSFAAQSFTTGTAIDLVTGTVVSTNPANGATNVPVNTTVQVVFSKAMSPASFDANNSFTLRDASNNVVPATITFSSDYKTATLQPKSSLVGGGATYYMEIGYQALLYDVDGNSLSYGYITFTTH